MFLKKAFSSDGVEDAFGVGDGVGDGVCARAAALDNKMAKTIPKWQNDLLLLRMALLRFVVNTGARRDETERAFFSVVAARRTIVPGGQLPGLERPG